MMADSLLRVPRAVNGASYSLASYCAMTRCLSSDTLVLKPLLDHAEATRIASLRLSTTRRRCSDGRCFMTPSMMKLSVAKAG